MSRGLLAVCLGVAFFALAPARAADADDFYLQAQGGLRWETRRLVQYGFSGGYYPWNELGIGLFADLTQDGSRGQYGGEFRWSFEPFEIDLRLGILRQSDANTGVTVGRFMGAAGLSYLVALTSSLAAKIEVRYHGFIRERSTLFTGLGGRILF